MSRKQIMRSTNWMMAIAGFILFLFGIGCAIWWVRGVVVSGNASIWAHPFAIALISVVAGLTIISESSETVISEVDDGK